MVSMDWFDYDLYDSDIGDYMDDNGFEYNLGESDDSQSTFISFNSGISTVTSSSSSSEDSSQDSDTQNTSQQQASVVIVDSGRGGILWRNRSDDDEESRMSSSSSSSIRSSGRGRGGGGQSIMEEDSSSPSIGQQRRRYFMRNRRQGQRISSSQSQEGEEERGNQNPPIVIESSDTETDNDEDEDRLLDEDNERNRVQAQLSREVQVQLSPTLPSAHAPPSTPHRTQQTITAPVDLTNDDTSNPGVNHDLAIAAQEVVTNVIVNLRSNPTNNPLVPERDAPTLREIARAAEKRKASTSPVQKKARLDSSQDSDDEVDAGCTICYDSYTAVGPHRPACLKCGHIFGYSCLERWLKVSCSGANRRCPSCNKKSNTKDIRLLYCSNLRPVDNTQVHQLTTDLEQKKIRNSKYKVEISSHKIKIESLEKELILYKGLEKQGLLQSNKPCDNVYAKGPMSYLTVSLVKSSGATGQIGMARSLIYDDRKQLLLATHQNGNPTGNGMFTGFGYSLVNLLNVSGATPLNKFFLVSPKAIRDACFHPLDSDLLLIASLDKTAKLIDVRTGSRVFNFNTESPLWSCAWDLTNPNLFLVGGVNGQLTFFDKRATAWSRPIVTGGTNVGVVSIIGIKAGPGRGLARGGFLVCKLNAVLSLERSEDPTSNQDTIVLLDACGPFMSMSYLESKNQVLLSSRPGPASVPNIRHRVFSLDQSPDGKPVLSLIQTILGGSLAPSLSRSYIWPSEVQGHNLVYAYDESTKSLCGWSVSDATKKVCLSCQDPILDICRVEDQSGPMLAALSDSAIRLYKHP